jgi:hypothetical protein
VISERDFFNWICRYEDNIASVVIGMKEEDWLSEGQEYLN